MLAIEQKVGSVARKAGIVTASAALTIVGAAFLTAAGWIYLAEVRSTLFAAGIIGLIYLALAALVLATGLASKTPRPSARTTAALDGLSPAQLVVLSFMQGLEQGRQTRRRS